MAPLTICKNQGGARPTQSQHSAEAPTVGPGHVPPPPSCADPMLDARRTTRPISEEYGRLGVPLHITEHQTSAVYEH